MGYLYYLLAFLFGLVCVLMMLLILVTVALGHWKWFRERVRA